jgi:flagellar export protein FliJ
MMAPRQTRPEVPRLAAVVRLRQRTEAEREGALGRALARAKEARRVLARLEQALLVARRRLAAEAAEGTTGAVLGWHGAALAALEARGAAAAEHLRAAEAAVVPAREALASAVGSRQIMERLVERQRATVLRAREAQEHRAADDLGLTRHLWARASRGAGGSER